MEILKPWLPHLAALAGMLLGTLVTWFVCRSKGLALHARYEERSKSSHKAIVDLEAACANLEAEVRQLRHSEATSLKRQSELEVLAQTQRRHIEDKNELLKAAEHRMVQNFRAITSETLKATQEEFLARARAAFEAQKQEASSELEQRRVAVETLVKPVAATLSKVENRIGDLERARRDSEDALGEQVRLMATAQAGLQRETSQLIQALRQSTGRGRWGEVQLKRVVELAGMEPYCDFHPPATGDRKAAGPGPDLIVRLPGGRLIAVDSHAPLEACLSSMEARSEEEECAEKKRFADMIGRHLNELAAKPYRSQFATPPEFVVLFLPSESFLASVLSEDPGMLERGIEQGVLLSTPATLVALLRSAAVGWRQEGIAEKARVISDAGRELYAHVSSLASHVAQVGGALDETVQKYNAAIGSLEGGVLPGARKLSDLGITATQDALPSLAPIGHAVRHPRTDLTKLPLARADDMDSLAVTGEIPDSSFEGFDGPLQSKLPSRSGKGAAKPTAAKQSPDADGAAGDLRAALPGSRKRAG